MTQQTINNGESYGVIRGKINANFTETYAASAAAAAAAASAQAMAAAAYTKPISGIPITDMTTGMQTSLGKADTALQQAAADVRYVRTVNGQAPDGTGNVTAGGAGGATNLTYTASPTGGLVASDTGTDATLPLADGTNAGLMAPAQFTKLAGIADPAAALASVTYDGSSRVTGYTRGGVAYTIAYPSSTSITVTGGGKVTTITLDGSGRVVGKVVA